MRFQWKYFGLKWLVEGGDESETESAIQCWINTGNGDMIPVCFCLLELVG